MTERGVVEAALFSAGQPVTVEEIAKTTGLPPDRVRASVRELAGAYDERGSAIEVAHIGDRWTMQIRAEYGEKAEAFAPPKLAKELLKTAALIAYHQPIKQSDLVRMVGGKAYEQVRVLADLRLITVKPFGQTLELKTSATFPEFFGLPVEDREEMRRYLSARTEGRLPTSGEPSPSIETGEREKHV